MLLSGQLWIIFQWPDPVVPVSASASALRPISQGTTRGQKKNLPSYKGIDGEDRIVLSNCSILTQNRWQCTDPPKASFCCGCWGTLCTKWWPALIWLYRMDAELVNFITIDLRSLWRLVGTWANSQKARSCQEMVHLSLRALSRISMAMSLKWWYMYLIKYRVNWVNGYKKS